MERPDDLEPGLPEGQAAEPEQLAQAEGEADSGEETADSGEEEEPTLAGPRPEAQADSAPRPEAQADSAPPWGRSRHPVLARIARIAAIALIGVAGAWLGMLLAGGASVQIGPVQTLMALRPSISGQTVVNVPPLGSLQMNTNHGPLQLNIDVRQLNETDVKQLVADPKSVASLPDIASAQLKHGVIAATIRAVIAAAIGSLVLGLIAFRRIWPTLAACGIAIGVLGIAGAIAATSLNPKSVLEPRYTGLLAEAPSLVGSTQNLVTKFGLYRTELAQLVTNVTRLYDTTADLPVYQPDTDAVRVLDVSDIHDNPAAWNIMHSIVQQFGINLIIDSGDLTDHGSQAENELATEIRKFPVPYVFIKGNHDSGSTQSAVAKVRNAILLTGQEVTVDGLTIIGDGDPRFTPNLSVQVRGEEAVYQTGQKLATAARGMVHEPDIAVVHDPVSAPPLNGAVKLVMAGHLHRRVSWMLSDATRVFVQGSTGGAGLRALQTNPPTPIEASVLYFGRADGQLQAWDDITIGGLGATDAQIQRHLASDTAPVGGPVPELGPTVSPSTMCGTPGIPGPSGSPGSPWPTDSTTPADSATPTDSSSGASPSPSR